MSFVKSKMNSLRKNQFLKNVAVLTGGTAVAQVLLPFAFMPILGRLYGPELQGIYGIYVYITSITQQIACFRYDYAIVVADSDEEAGGALQQGGCHENLPHPAHVLLQGAITAAHLHISSHYALRPALPDPGTALLYGSLWWRDPAWWSCGYDASGKEVDDSIQARTEHHHRR